VRRASASAVLVYAIHVARVELPALPHWFWSRVRIHRNEQ